MYIHFRVTECKVNNSMVPVQVLAVPDIYTIPRVPSGFSGNTWLNNKRMMLKKDSQNPILFFVFAWIFYVCETMGI